MAATVQGAAVADAVVEVVVPVDGPLEQLASATETTMASTGAATRAIPWPLDPRERCHPRSDATTLPFFTMVPSREPR